MAIAQTAYGGATAPIPVTDENLRVVQSRLAITSMLAGIPPLPWRNEFRAECKRKSRKIVRCRSGMAGILLFFVFIGVLLCLDFNNLQAGLSWALPLLVCSLVALLVYWKFGIADGRKCLIKEFELWRSDILRHMLTARSCNEAVAPNVHFLKAIKINKNTLLDVFRGNSQIESWVKALTSK